MKKERHNPNKSQNRYGGDYDYPNYDFTPDGVEFCHDEVDVGWNEFIKWAQKDKKSKLICKGNRHNCYTLKLKWLSSLPEEKRKQFN